LHKRNVRREIVIVINGSILRFKKRAKGEESNVDELVFRARNLTIVAPIIYERYYEFGEVLAAKNKIGKEPPICCGQIPPKENGLCVCKCGRHIIRMADKLEQISLAQICEIAPDIAIT